ncbi:hypothetical protein [Sphingomonas sanguinis]|uniref:hypothetical protein n=1 Tax=Sphingomonas sanguinis TaxID=33051 RepID=UPI00077BBED7|nr:hypothetical protein [Sphingomonas sanguinis]
MSQYRGPDGIVDAEQWNGQPLAGVTIIQRKWGVAGAVQVVDGEQWMAPGDWLIRGNDALWVVSPAIFAVDYHPMSA